jgi:hypothetical protein
MNYNQKMSESYADPVPMKEPELPRFSAILNKERCRMQGLIAEINERLNTIYNYSPGDTGLKQNDAGVGRNDILAAMQYDLYILSEQNEALERINLHLRQLV